MIEHTHQTAPTRFVEVGELTVAYRRFGRAGGVPLVLLQHFTGTMDNWDPAVTDGLSAGREVILFDNAGIAPTTGTTPSTVAEMARDALSFIDALGLEQVDLFGFSLGGMIVQQIAVDRPELVRRLIVVGSGPRGGEGMESFSAETQALFGTEYENPDEQWLPLFFSPSEESQAAGQKFLDRMTARQEGRDPRSTMETAVAQLQAVAEWGAPAEGSYTYLRGIDKPVLVVNGSNDVIIPTVNSYILQQNLPNAQLVVYPDSNHGSQYQFPELFVAQVNLFLEG